MAASAAAQAAAADVLRCANFDEARQRFPSVIHTALRGGPPEEVFREQWSPGAQYHASLKATIAKAAAGAAESAAPAGAGRAAPRRKEQAKVEVIPEPMVGVQAEDVLACRSFTEAGIRFPAIVKLALRHAPPEETTESQFWNTHWAKDAQFHEGLKSAIEKAVKLAVEGPRRAREVQPLQLEDVMACATFSEAKERYPQVVKHALQRGGPPEEVFHANWSKDAEFHQSLRTLIAQTVAAAVRPDGDKIEIKRHSDGEFWGFLVGKKMKVLSVNSGSPAERGGLKKGVFIQQVETERGIFECEKPADAYGPQTGPSPLALILTVSKDAPAFSDVEAPAGDEQQPREQPQKKEADTGYADVGFEIAKRSREDGDAGHWSSRPDADAVALQYIRRKKEEAKMRQGSSHAAHGDGRYAKRGKNYGMLSQAEGGPAPGGEK